VPDQAKEYFDSWRLIRTAPGSEQAVPESTGYPDGQNDVAVASLYPLEHCGLTKTAMTAGCNWRRRRSNSITLTSMSGVRSSSAEF
jgi:hypothetical protein